LGANKGYASKNLYPIIKNHTLLSTTKCRVGARGASPDDNIHVEEDRNEESQSPKSSLRFTLDEVMSTNQWQLTNHQQKV
jgi:hypothetical protein